MVQQKHRLIFDELPAILPIFPVGCAMLLPNGRLPLNIFEPRYISMIDHALAGNRLIGMVQPRNFQGEHEMDAITQPPVYEIGGAGRLVAFEETIDQRYEIVLQGLCRFAIAEELEVTDGFRNVRPDWSPFKSDFETNPSKAIDRTRLRKLAPVFFKLNGIQADWDILEGTTDENLVNSLAMGCPFSSNEKQALLEARDLSERAEILSTLIEMAVIESSGAGAISQ